MNRNSILLALLAALCYFHPAQAQSEGAQVSKVGGSYKHAWLVSLNNATMYSGSFYPSITWKRVVSPRSAIRYGLSFRGQFGGNSTKQTTYYADTSRTDRTSNNSGDGFGGSPTSFAIERQSYWSERSEFRFYHLVGGSAGLSFSSSYRSYTTSTTDSKTYGISVGPHFGIGVEWDCQPRVSIFIENQAYLVFDWSRNESDTNYSGSNPYRTHYYSDEWSVSAGLGYTKLGAAYYF